MSFLDAAWRKLILANYAVDPALLEKYLPAKTELDLWNGSCYVSLVGFYFQNTKMLGMKIPFHVNFEEVNLRFYVRHFDGKIWKRGVVFIREIVPKPAISIVANTVYKEHYVSRPMKHLWQEESDHRKVEYQWKLKGNWQKIAVQASLNQREIELESEAEFITEHYWGYSRHGANKTIEYEVTHPRWMQYDVLEYTIDVDFGLNYGPEFSFLNHQIPNSVMLAEGSPITVESKKVI